MRSSCTSVGPKFNDGCSQKKRRRYTEMQKKRPCEDGDRNVRDAAASLGMSTWGEQKLDKAGRILPWSLWRQFVLLDFGFLTSGTIEE